MKKHLNKYLLLFSFVISIIFILSLKYRFLDGFLIGTSHENIGFDFFSVPRAFLNLQINKSIFSTWILPYGPYATWYPYHPFISIIIGAPLSLFKPWISYLIFVFFSLTLLYFSAYKIKIIFKDQFYSNISYLFLVASFPTYLMIWNAQMHIFLVASVTFIIIDYVKMIYFDYRKNIYPLLLIGILLSLFSKPLIMLFFPILFINKYTFKTALTAIFIYLSISILFIVIKYLNPENNNQLHWYNIIYQSKELAFNKEYFSLSAILINTYGLKLNLLLFKLPLLFVYLLSILVIFIKGFRLKNEISLLLLIMILFSYFLSYNMIWEYHYTILLPLVPIFMFIKNYEKDIMIKFCFKIIFIFSLTLYLPTTYFFYKITLISDYTYSYQLIRIIPVLINFILIGIVIYYKIKEYKSFYISKKWGF